MPVDQSFKGRVYPPTRPYEVSREKIREFADAINDDNPAYRDRAVAESLGYPDVIAPPTFPIILTLKAGHQVITDPDFGIDYSRVVHGEQHRREGDAQRPAGHRTTAFALASTVWPPTVAVSVTSSSPSSRTAVTSPRTVRVAPSGSGTTTGRVKRTP